MKITSIGYVSRIKERVVIKLQEEFLEGLMRINAYSHLEIVWWANLTDTKENRKQLKTENLFKKGPEALGIFSTRSPIRPNPIMISIIEVEEVYFQKGLIYTKTIDAENGSPVIDVKPYHQMQRVKELRQPHWCEGWPKWYEEISGFNWKKIINFESNE